MRLIFTILFLWSFVSNATIYYVDNAGNDSNNGTSTGTAWQTIAKVNSVSFNPGDQVLFKAGGSWNEKLIVASSGTSGNVITFGSYGVGSKPIITGFQTLTGFANVGNIWTATATNSVPTLNTVLIDGTIAAKGRFPNYGFLTFTGSSGQTQITGSLTGTPNYTGAEAVVRTRQWILDVRKITSQTAGQLNFSALTYTPTNGNGYFIQNTESVLDTLREWCYDSASKVLKVYSSGSPTVQISTIDTLVYLHNKNYITFDGLAFTGANRTAIRIDTGRSITIQNCSFTSCGDNAIWATAAPQTLVKKDSLQNILSTSVYIQSPTNSGTTITNPCDSSQIDSSYFRNIGMMDGMGASDNQTYMGAYIVGRFTKFTNNKMYLIGYSGVYWNGPNSNIQYNLIDSFCMRKNDGGGIYTYLGSYWDANYNTGSYVRNNIVKNGIGVSAGVGSGLSPCAGIYFDNNTQYVTAQNNTVFNCLVAGILLNGGNHQYYYDNTVINGIGNGINLSQTGYGFVGIKRNILYSTVSTMPVFMLWGSEQFSIVDSNYYLRPSAENNKLQQGNNLRSLAYWRTNYGYDSATVETPSGITSALPLIVFNPSLTPLVQPLLKTYKDAKGVIRSNSITIPAFGSAILFLSEFQKLRLKLKVRS